MRIFFDMASVIWTGLRAGKDVEGIEVVHNGKTMLVNSAGYGYENCVNHIVSALKRWNLTPKDMVMVFEGKDSKKRRCMILTEYKAKRDDNKCPEMYVQYNLLKEQLMQVFRDLGAIAVTQNFVEGDDVLAWLAQNTEEDCVVSTNDNDLITLNGVNAYGAKCMVAINGEVGLNKYGEFDFALVTLYKSLVGDSSDNVSGVRGFGPAAFLNLMARYGEDGLYELMSLIEEGKRDELAVLAKENSCKLLQKIVDNWDDVVKSFRVVLLHPEWVNTVRQPLEWMPGMVKAECSDERLRGWRAQSRLVTAENYEQALEFLKSKLAENDEVAFDIETSVLPEGEDWLAAQGNPDGVDVIGSILTGYSITFGANNQYTYYVSVDHAETDNVTMSQARKMLEHCFQKKLIIQNTAFELPVLYGAQDEDGTLWRDCWQIYGAGGMIPNILDTLFEGSYVDENLGLGLKFRSQHHLGYRQTSYKETMTIEDLKGTLPKGGTFLCEEDYGEHGIKESRFYKMRELSAQHVFKYGTDDTICTAALHNFYKLHMMLEHHWKIYLQVELPAAYLHARSFYDGVSVSISKCKELEAEDDLVYNEAWAILREYLRSKSWEGTVAPNYTAEITAKEIKEAYAIVFGIQADSEDDDDDEDLDLPKVKDEFLSTRTRTPAKLAAMLEALGHEAFAANLKGCIAGNCREFTEYVRSFFNGEPLFKASNKQMQRLLYETMQLPIRVRGKPTEKMRAAGIKQGNPKGDALAIAYALRDAPPNIVAVLEAIKLMQMVRTRRSFYYTKYPNFVHWKTGKIHSSHNQCATNTRRASSSKPNFQQLPKHPKIEGYESKFRQVIIPHKKSAVVVSMDFAAQELRVIADYSQDDNMLACYMGDNKRDMHALTGSAILAKEEPKMVAELIDNLEVKPANKEDAEYTAFLSLEGSNAKVFKEYRALGKKVNFTTEFGAAAPKLAATLLIEETDAQTYIEAKEKAFPKVVSWKKKVQEEAKELGYVRTKMGAVRHLTNLLNSPDRFIASKADRQAVNFKVQGSSAEMTKLAEGRMFEKKLCDRFDVVYYGPVHDETVWSVSIKDLQAFLTEAHACMVVTYADMQLPIESSISFGPSFGDQLEIGSAATQEAVSLGLSELGLLG